MAVAFALILIGLGVGLVWMGVTGQNLAGAFQRVGTIFGGGG